MDSVPKSPTTSAPRVILEAEVGEQRFRYVLIPYRTVPWAVVEVQSRDALGKECWIRVSPGNKDDYQVAMAAIVSHLAQVQERDA